jgi:hypothetical protein
VEKHDLVAPGGPGVAQLDEAAHAAEDADVRQEEGDPHGSRTLAGGLADHKAAVFHPRTRSFQIGTVFLIRTRRRELVRPRKMIHGNGIRRRHPMAWHLQ